MKEQVLVTGASYFDLTSVSNQREYRIFVGAPDGEAPEEGYPVLYVLDGNAVFSIVAETARLLGGNHPRAFGSLLVVGIGYPSADSRSVERVYDYTPPADPSVLPPRKDGKPWPPTGGCDEFIRFIEEQVKPQIERQYPVNRSRQSLFGHSLGGLFTLYTLFRRPELYRSYIAGSPSIWWNNGSLLQEEQAFADRIQQAPADVRLLLSAGELELHHPMRMLGNAEDMYNRLASHSGAGVDASFHAFAGEGHLSVLPALIGRTVQYALEREHK
ncbi:alpha/beta hydrolase [Paenibacillus sp. NPDC056579]|uniref:alpha/beta hydrolase n=1 Tax=unclassified Paenibacillus TaxID=185978 RepID=UPI001EF97BC0|nr:alpha/beta hydrolase-fold protein [Paenibacillus sp. H1-7]ULL13831.1 alpha/beta hydrolase [Paenibacillus sp. H1-7]